MKEAFEKIKERLEKKRDKCGNMADGSCFDGYHEEEIEYLAMQEAYENAIKIVDQVAEEFGISEQVCEWKPGKVGDDWNPGCEPNSTYTVWGVAWFRKCPYCGKKIKVVE